MFKNTKFIILILAGLMSCTMVNAEVITESQCFMFKHNKFIDKKSCQITDYQTLGSFYSLEYNIKGYGVFESQGGLDKQTMKEYRQLNDEDAINQIRLRSNYKIVKLSNTNKFSSKKHLSCVKKIKSTFEICS